MKTDHKHHKHPIWAQFWRRLRNLLFGTTYYVVHKDGTVVKVRGVRHIQNYLMRVHACDPGSTTRRLVSMEHMALFWGLVFLKHEVVLSRIECFTTVKPAPKS